MRVHTSWFTRKNQTTMSLNHLDVPATLVSNLTINTSSNFTQLDVFFCDTTMHIKDTNVSTHMAEFSSQDT